MSGMSKRLLRNKQQQRERKARSEYGGKRAGAHGAAEVNC
jgi:hypothetical protein